MSAAAGAHRAVRDLLKCTLAMAAVLPIAPAASAEATCSKFLALQPSDRSSAQLDALELPAAAVRIPLELAFRPGETKPGKSLVDALQHLLDCSERAGLRHGSWIVLGYASAHESGDGHALALAHDRADAVARRLRSSGMDVRQVRGADSEAGSATHPAARVELWLLR